MARGVARHLVLYGSLCAATILVSHCGGETGRDVGGHATGSGGGDGSGNGAAAGVEPAAAGTAGGVSSPDGGSPSGSGGTDGTGGDSASGGASAAGGAVASGGATGGAGTGGDGGVAGAAGHPPDDFCTGETRVLSQGQTLSPPLTIAPSVLMRSCCFDYSIRLHTAATLGLDLVVDVGVMVGEVEAGEYVQGGSDNRVTARVRHSTDLEYAPSNVSGTVRLFDAFALDEPWDLSVCLEVNDPDSALLGTRVHVPRLTITPYYEWSDYFEIYLLADPTVTAADAVDLPLDSLVLADVPLVDLVDVEFVEAATGWVALNQGQISDVWLHDQIGQVSVQGLPFVVESRGVRIYLGAFYTAVSSYLPPCPLIEVELIQTDGFTIQPPWNGDDPRSDPRLLEALTETSRLVP